MCEKVQSETSTWYPPGTRCRSTWSFNRTREGKTWVKVSEFTISDSLDSIMLQTLNCIFILNLPSFNRTIIF